MLVMSSALCLGILTSLHHYQNVEMLKDVGYPIVDHDNIGTWTQALVIPSHIEFTFQRISQKIEILALKCEAQKERSSHSVNEETMLPL